MILAPPTASDGLDTHALVRASGVLDENSVYAYCAGFRHFPDTSVVAREGGRLAGFVLGYRIPARPDTLFVWQVGVDDAFRGQGLATRLLRDVIRRSGATWLETTITPGNGPSRSLFRGLARRLEAGCEVRAGIAADELGDGHEREDLFRIGPFHRGDP